MAREAVVEQNGADVAVVFERAVGARVQRGAQRRRDDQRKTRERRSSGTSRIHHVCLPRLVKVGSNWNGRNVQREHGRGHSGRQTIAPDMIVAKRLKAKGSAWQHDRRLVRHPI